MLPRPRITSSSGSNVRVFADVVIGISLTRIWLLPLLRALPYVPLDSYPACISATPHSELLKSHPSALSLSADSQMPCQISLLRVRCRPRIRNVLVRVSPPPWLSRIGHCPERGMSLGQLIRDESIIVSPLRSYPQWYSSSDGRSAATTTACALRCCVTWYGASQVSCPMRPRGTLHPLSALALNLSGRHRYRAPTLPHIYCNAPHRSASNSGAGARCGPHGGLRDITPYTSQSAVAVFANAAHFCRKPKSVHQAS
ncbi:hypothetical protein EI94DRAFT_378094 [Lactarius quietus]|nr:hypothetical protein EI94DRAFT_378094 [Lactarius quietus]